MAIVKSLEHTMKNCDKYVDEMMREATELGIHHARIGMPMNHAITHWIFNTTYRQEYEKELSNVNPNTVS